MYNKRNKLFTVILAIIASFLLFGFNAETTLADGVNPPPPSTGSPLSCENLGMESISSESWNVHVIYGMSVIDFNYTRPEDADYIVVNTGWEWSGRADQRQITESHTVSTPVGQTTSGDLGNEELAGLVFWFDQLHGEFEGDSAKITINYAGNGSDPGSHRSHGLVEFCRSEQPTGSVTALKTNPEGEPLEGVTAELLLNSVVIANGEMPITFDDLELGTYTLREVYRDDMVAVGPTSYTFELTEGEATAHRSFTFVNEFIVESACDSNEATLDEATMSVSGHAEGRGIGWQVINTATSTVLDEGPGNVAHYSFENGAYEAVYQVQYLSNDGTTWSTTGCLFTFEESQTVPNGCADATVTVLDSGDGYAVVETSVSAADNNTAQGTKVTWGDGTEDVLMGSGPWSFGPHRYESAVDATFIIEAFVLIDGEWVGSETLCQGEVMVYVERVDCQFWMEPSGYLFGDTSHLDPFGGGSAGNTSNCHGALDYVMTIEFVDHDGQPAEGKVAIVDANIIHGDGTTAAMAIDGHSATFTGTLGRYAYDHFQVQFIGLEAGMYAMQVWVDFTDPITGIPYRNGYRTGWMELQPGVGIPPLPAYLAVDGIAIVQSGESLADVASRLGVAEEDLLAANALWVVNNGQVTLYDGMKLFIPGVQPIYPEFQVNADGSLTMP